jgi:3-methylfumaryl-CoA hydratase
MARDSTNLDSINSDSIRQWIGNTQTAVDHVTVAPLRALAATLDRTDPDPQPGEPIPPCWHWLYFLPIHRHSELGSDGHALRGGFLPPIPLPLRMWAGSGIEFVHALRVGDSIQKVSRIVDVTEKEGSGGPLVFVRVRHEISNAAGLAVIDEHDIVYRQPAPAKAPERSSVPAAETPDWIREIQPDDVLLFRYSALTFNSHRIHYNHRYVSEVEKYPGLVVHGPLIATLLLDLLRRNLPDAQVSRFAFRAVKPTYEGTTLHLCGRRGTDGATISLWAQHADGAVAMQATATLA